METDHAVVVGINRYGALDPLDGPVNDAMAFRDWLVDPAGGDVPGENVRLVLSTAHEPSPDPLTERPSCQDVDDAFAKVVHAGRLARQSGKALGRRLYIFMAGHGLGPDLHDAALLVANADAAEFSGYNVPGRPYAAWFETAAYFEEVALFMDCCRDSLDAATFRGVPFGRLRADAESAKVHHLYGFATRASRKARERAAPDGRVRGLFSRALVEGLRGGALVDGQVTGQSLHAFVLREYERSLREGEHQEPHFEVQVGHDLVFLDRHLGAAGAAAPAAAPGATVGATVIVTFADPVPAQARILDGTLAVAASVDAPQRSWACALPRGLYLAQAADREKSFAVVGEEAVHVTV